MRFPTKLFRRAAVCAVLTLSVAVSTAGQRNQGAPRPVWAPVYPPDLGAMTGAERAAAMATMDEVERILSQVPELAQPQGFEVGKQIYGGTHHLGERAVFAYSFILWFFVPTKAAAPGGEGSRCIGVNINNFGVGEGRPLEDEAGRYLFVEGDIGDPIPGATIVHEGLRWDTPTADRRGGSVTFTSHGSLPWIAVTREDYLRAQIYDAEGKNGEKEKEFRQALEKTSYERWVEAAAERTKTRDDAVAAMTRAQGRAAAEELRKTLEQTEREASAQLKAAEDEERKQSQAALVNRYGDQLRAQLAAMSPAERASPARAAAGGSLVAHDAPFAHRVLTPDPEFWRVRRSRAEVHSITLGFIPTFFCAHPAVRAALEKTYRTINAAAFRRIVDRLQ